MALLGIPPLLPPPLEGDLGTPEKPWRGSAGGSVSWDWGGEQGRRVGGELDIRPAGGGPFTLGFRSSVCDMGTWVSGYLELRPQSQPGFLEVCRGVVRQVV